MLWALWAQVLPTACHKNVTPTSQSKGQMPEMMMSQTSHPLTKAPQYTLSGLPVHTGTYIQ